MKANKNTSIETMDFQTTKGDTSLRVVNDENSLHNVLLIFNHKGKEETLSFHYDEIKNYGEKQGGEIEECIKDFFNFYHEVFGYFTMGAYKSSKYTHGKYPKLSQWHDPYNGSYIVYVDQSEHEEPIDIVFNRLKEEYKDEILQFLNEFGLKMVNGSFDLDNDEGYYYFEDTNDSNEEGVYMFGLSSMTEFLEFEDERESMLSLDINKIHYSL